MIERKNLDPERDGLPWIKAFSDFAEPQLSKRLVKTGQQAFGILERLEKKDRRWFEPKYFSREALHFNISGEDWEQDIDATLWGRDKGIQVIHDYRHAYKLLYGWFINMLRDGEMLGYARQDRVGHLLPIGNKEWRLESWVGTKAEPAVSSIAQDGDLYLSGQRYFDLHIICCGHIESNSGSASISRTRKQNTEKQDKIERKIRHVLALAREKQFTNSGINAVARELEPRKVGYGYESIRKILRGTHPLMILRNIPGIRNEAGNNTRA